MRRALIAHYLRQLACAIGGHWPSDLLAVLYDLDHPVCRFCGKEFR